MWYRPILSLFLFLCSVPSTWAGIHTESVVYQQGDTALEGFLAYDDARKGKLPGILVIHDWMGAAYHPQADKRSFDAMRRFFDEVFGAT